MTSFSAQDAVNGFLNLYWQSRAEIRSGKIEVETSEQHPRQLGNKIQVSVLIRYWAIFLQALLRLLKAPYPFFGYTSPQAMPAIPHLDKGFSFTLGTGLTSGYVYKAIHADRGEVAVKIAGREHSNKEVSSPQ